MIFAKLELLIVHSTNKNRTTALADIIFPTSTFSEKNGTMVNFQGRIQRIRPAVATLDLDRSLDGMSMSRLDKFGTEFDRWEPKQKNRCTGKLENNSINCVANGNENKI